MWIFEYHFSFNYICSNQDKHSLKPNQLLQHLFKQVLLLQHLKQLQLHLLLSPLQHLYLLQHLLYSSLLLLKGLRHLLLQLVFLHQLILVSLSLPVVHRASGLDHSLDSLLVNNSLMLLLDIIIQIMGNSHSQLQHLNNQM